MSKKVTWWPVSTAKDIHQPVIVLMRYDWPGERIYQIGIYDQSRFNPWTDGKGGALQVPDYYTPCDKIVEFINIPPEAEYTYDNEVTNDQQ